MIRELLIALRRVGNEYRDAAQLPGDREVHVHVELVGLAREEYARLIARFEASDHVTVTRRPPCDALARERRCVITATALSVSGPVAATTYITDALRQALADENLTAGVSQFAVTADLATP